jgi:hypothetical protein
LTSTQEETFPTLNEVIYREPSLKIPGFMKQFMLVTATSGVSIGVFLSPKIGNKEHPMAYASRMLTKQREITA